MWNKILRDTVLEPLLRRLGTAAAASLVVGGDWLCEHLQACGLVTPNGATATVTWVIAAALVAFDLATSRLASVKQERKVINKLYAQWRPAEPDSGFAPDKPGIVK